MMFQYFFILNSFFFNFFYIYDARPKFHIGLLKPQKILCLVKKEAFF